MLINAISDTHGLTFDTKRCDLLLFAGDYSRLPKEMRFYKKGLLKEAHSCLDWLSSQPAQKIIMIAGNHDFACELKEFRDLAASYGVRYIEDEAITYKGVTIYGYPWTPFYGNYAFNNLRFDPASEDAKAKLSKVPEGTDILLSHGPPLLASDDSFGKALGCPILKDTVHKIQPKYVVCGHIHESAGAESKIWDTTVLNVSARTFGMMPRDPTYTTFEI